MESTGAGRAAGSQDDGAKGGGDPPRRLSCQTEKKRAQALGEPGRTRGDMRMPGAPTKLIDAMHASR
jgi:hypothetical protein